MEYIFGTVTYNDKNYQNLKTVGDTHTDLKGITAIERKYTDAVITDYFNVIKKYRTKEDDEGRCYDWYLINEHYRDTDKFTPSNTLDKIKDLENALCELSK